MDLVTNQNSAAANEGDKMHSGLGPKNPTVGKDGRALPHAIVGIDVSDKPHGKAKRRDKNSAPTLAVPKEAIRDSRIGGTIALLCAAAISAQTLFALGRLIGLSPWTAWLLPAALDVYAMTATRVAFQVPVGHTARDKAIWNARVALFFTISSNCLYHAMHLAKGHHNWTASDWALVGVSALPPIVVERLLHLQSIVNSGATETVATPATPIAATPPSKPAATKTPVAETTPATPKPQPVATPQATPVATPPVAKPAAQADSNATVATLIPKSEQLRIVAELVATHGPDVPLAEIIAKLGCHKSTASRLRTAVNEESGTANPPAGEGEREVI